MEDGSLRHLELMTKLPSKSARRRDRRHARKRGKEARYRERSLDFNYRRAAELQQEARQQFEAEEARRLELLRRRQAAMAAALAESVDVFETQFPGFDYVDLVRARAYMLGKRHDCHALPIMLSIAVGDYRRDLLARELRAEPATQAVAKLTAQQLQEVINAVTRHFDDLLELSDGLRNCASWHPCCRSTSDYIRSRRHKRHDQSRRWKHNVLTVYVRYVGISAIEELYSYAQIPLPHWLRKLQQTHQFLRIA